MTDTDALLVPTNLDSAPLVAEADADNIACAVHMRACIRERLEYGKDDTPVAVHVRCIHTLHDYDSSYLARYPYPKDHDRPNRWEDLKPREHDEAKALARLVDLPTANVYAVAKWLSAFRDFADGNITSAELWRRTQGEHGEEPD